MNTAKLTENMHPVRLLHDFHNRSKAAVRLCRHNEDSQIDLQKQLFDDIVRPCSLSLADRAPSTLRVGLEGDV